MRRIATTIEDVILLETERHADERGYLEELHGRAALAAVGVEHAFVQDNLSYSPAAWTVRGLHFQTLPHAQAKLVRVLTGAAFTVAVDLRRGSPSFGRHVGTRLEATAPVAMLVPEGFAHGILTLLPETRVLWALTAGHAPAHATGIAWDDPDLAIPWPAPARPPLVSAKDRALPRLREIASPFTWAGAVAADRIHGA